MRNQNRKKLMGKGKKWISAILAVLLLFNACCSPALAREGNPGSKGPLEMWALGFFAGLVTDISIIFSGGAGFAGSVASNLTGLYMYYNNYREYGQPLFSIGNITITKGAFYSMVAGTVAGAITGLVSGALSGGGSAAGGAASGATSAAASSTAQAIVHAIIEAIKSLIKSIAKAIVEFIKAMVKAVMNFIKELVRNPLKAIVDFISDIAKAVVNLFKNLFVKTYQNTKKAYSEALKKPAKSVTKEVADGAVKEGAQVGVEAGKVGTEIVKVTTATTKVTTDTTKAIVSNAAKQPAKTMIQKIKDFLTHPVRSMKEWLQNGKLMNNPYFKYGSGNQYGMATVHLAGDLTIGTAKLVASEAVKQKLEKQGWDETLASIAGSVVATYAGAFSTGVVRRLYGTPFKFKLGDNSSYLTEDEFKALENLDQLAQEKIYVDSQDHTITEAEYQKLGEGQKKLYTVGELSQAKVRVFVYVDKQGKPVLNKDGKPISKEEYHALSLGGKGGIKVVESKTTFQEANNNGQLRNIALIKSSDEKSILYPNEEFLNTVGTKLTEYKGELEANKDLFLMTGGLWNDFSGRPITESRGFLGTGLTAMRQVGLRPVISGATRILVLKALDYETDYSGEKEPVYENLWKMALAEGAGNLTGSFVANLNAFNSWYAGTTERYEDEKGKTIVRHHNPWDSRQGLSLGKYMLKSTAEELGKAGLQIAWGYYAKKNDIESDAVSELGHLMASSVASGAIDALFRKDPVTAELDFVVLEDKGSPGERRVVTLDKLSLYEPGEVKGDKPGEVIREYKFEGRTYRQEGNVKKLNLYVLEKEGIPFPVLRNNNSQEEITLGESTNSNVIGDISKGKGTYTLVVGKDSGILKGDPYLAERLAVKDRSIILSASILQDFNNYFIQAVLDSSLLPYNLRSAGTGPGAFMNDWGVQDKFISHVSAMAKGSSPLEAAANRLSQNLNAYANWNFGESFGAALSNRWLPPEHRSYAAFITIDKALSRRVDEKKSQQDKVKLHIEEIGKLEGNRKLLKLYQELIGNTETKAGLEKLAEEILILDEKQERYQNLKELLLITEEVVRLGIEGEPLKEWLAAIEESTGGRIEVESGTGNLCLTYKGVAKYGDEWQDELQQINQEITDLKPAIEEKRGKLGIEHREGEGLKDVTQDVSTKLGQVDNRISDLQLDIEIAKFTQGLRYPTDDISTDPIFKEISDKMGADIAAKLGIEKPEEKIKPEFDIEQLRIEKQWYDDKINNIESEILRKGMETLELPKDILFNQNNKENVFNDLTLIVPKLWQKEMQQLDREISNLESAKASLDWISCVPVIGAMFQVGRLAGLAYQEKGYVNLNDIILGGIVDYQVNREIVSMGMKLTKEQKDKLKGLVDASKEHEETKIRRKAAIDKEQFVAIESSYSSSIAGVAQPIEQWSNFPLATAFKIFTGENAPENLIALNETDAIKRAQEFIDGTRNINLTREQEEELRSKLSEDEKTSYLVKILMDSNIDAIKEIEGLREQKEKFGGKEGLEAAKSFTWIPKDDEGLPAGVSAREEKLDNLLRLNALLPIAFYDEKYGLTARTDVDDFGRRVKTTYYGKEYDSADKNWNMLKLPKTTEYYYNSFGLALALTKDYSEIRFPRVWPVESRTVVDELAKTESKKEEIVIKSVPEEKPKEVKEKLEPDQSEEVKKKPQLVYDEGYLPRKEFDIELTPDEKYLGSSINLGGWRGEAGEEEITPVNKLYGRFVKIENKNKPWWKDLWTGVQRGADAWAVGVGLKEDYNHGLWDTFTLRIEQSGPVNQTDSVSQPSEEIFNPEKPFDLGKIVIEGTPQSPQPTQPEGVKREIPSYVQTPAKTHIEEKPLPISLGPNITYDVNVYSTGKGQSPYTGPTARLVYSDINSGAYLSPEYHYRLPSGRIEAEIRQELKQLIRDAILFNEELKVPEEIKKLIDEKELQEYVELLRQDYYDHKVDFYYTNTKRGIYPNIHTDMDIFNKWLDQKNDEVAKVYEQIRQGGSSGGHSEHSEVHSPKSESPAIPLINANIPEERLKDIDYYITYNPNAKTTMPDIFDLIPQVTELSNKGIELEKQFNRDLSNVKELHLYQYQQFQGRDGTDKTYPIPTWAMRQGYGISDESKEVPRFLRIQGNVYDLGGIQTRINQRKSTLQAEPNTNPLLLEDLQRISWHNVAGNDEIFVRESPADTYYQSFYEQAKMLNDQPGYEGLVPLKGLLEPGIGAEPAIPFSEVKGKEIEAPTILPNDSKGPSISNEVPTSSPPEIKTRGLGRSSKPIAPERPVELTTAEIPSVEKELPLVESPSPVKLPQAEYSLSELKSEAEVIPPIETTIAQATPVMSESKRKNNFEEAYNSHNKDILDLHRHYENGIGGYGPYDLEEDLVNALSDTPLSEPLGNVIGDTPLGKALGIIMGREVHLDINKMHIGPDQIGKEVAEAFLLNLDQKSKEDLKKYFDKPVVKWTDIAWDSGWSRAALGFYFKRKAADLQTIAKEIGLTPANFTQEQAIVDITSANASLNSMQRGLLGWHVENLLKAKGINFEFNKDGVPTSKELEQALYQLADVYGLPREEATTSLYGKHFVLKRDGVYEVSMNGSAYFISYAGDATLTQELSKRVKTSIKDLPQKVEVRELDPQTMFPKQPDESPTTVHLVFDESRKDWDYHTKGINLGYFFTSPLGEKIFWEVGPDNIYPTAKNVIEEDPHGRLGKYNRGANIARKIENQGKDLSQSLSPKQPQDERFKGIINYPYIVGDVLGASRIGHSHTGIDIFAPRGTPIYSPEEVGVVVFSGYLDELHGETAVMQHPNGKYTVYSHADELFVNPGEVIQQGQRIATVGSSGNASRPHLHLEVAKYSGNNTQELLSKLKEFKADYLDPGEAIRRDSR